MFFRINHILFFAAICIVFSCTVQQPVAETDPIDDYSSQEKAELSVKSYLRKTYDTLGSYTPYGFGVVKEQIPEQVIQLEELREMKKILPGMKDHYADRLDSVMTAYDTMIAQKEREIKTKKIKSFWKISHLYLWHPKGDSIRINEVEFTLDPNFKVYDAHTTLYAGITADEAGWFDFYYNQYPLFDTWDDEADDKRSQEIYDFFDKKLMQTTEGKGAVMKQVLFLIRHIKVSGEFSNQKLAQAVIQNKVKGMTGVSYQPIKFSNLQAIIKKSGDGTQELIGYSMVHLFKFSSENLIVEKAFYFEFDPWLIMAGYLPVQAPYDSYFEN